jgi:hypothetical protein
MCMKRNIFGQLRQVRTTYVLHTLRKRLGHVRFKPWQPRLSGRRLQFYSSTVTVRHVKELSDDER